MHLEDVAVETVAAVGADIGEGPSWDARSQTLLFVDITPGRIYRFAPDSGSLDHVDVGQEVGAAVPRSRGGLVVAARDGIGTLADGSDVVDIFAAVEGDASGNRMNDAKCDPQGRLWAGTMAFDLQAAAASLYRIGQDRSVTRVLTDVTISNGLGWSPTGDLMYYIDSTTYGVDAYAFDGATGRISSRERLITFSEEDGMPDGLTVDAEGGIWVALWGGSELRRHHPDGSESGSIKLPVTQVTSACFGGPTLQDLYITSAASGLDAAALERQPLAGSLFACRPGVAGLPTTPFAG